MRYMGLDLGSKTLGVAISDPTKTIANVLTTIRFKDENYDLLISPLADIIKEYQISKIILGYPKNMNGTIGERAQACEAMAHKLEEMFPACKVVLWDERLSTVAAEKVLVDADMRRKKRKQVIDMMAAVVILQNYLDSKSFKI